MSSKYVTVRPDSQQPLYNPSSTVTFRLDTRGFKIVPGTVKVQGLIACLADSTPGAFGYVGDDTQLFMDGPAGIHAIIQSIDVNMESTGNIETIVEYDRLAGVMNRFTVYDESLGTESITAPTLAAPNERIKKGIMQGASGLGPEYPIAGAPVFGSYQPFSAPLRCCLNRASDAYSTQNGVITVTVLTRAATDVFYGEAAAALNSYVLTDLELAMTLIPDDGTRKDIVFETHAVTTVTINSIQQTYPVPIITPCRSLTTTYVAQSNKNTQANPNLVCQPPPGIPPYGYTGGGQVSLDHGVERLTYSISDVDDELVDFQFTSRSEITLNGLRALGVPPAMWGGVLRRNRHPVPAYRDGYVSGIDFGGLMRFGPGQNTFSYYLETQCDNAANAYLAINDFKGYKVIKA